MRNDDLRAHRAHPNWTGRVARHAEDLYGGPVCFYTHDEMRRRQRRAERRSLWIAFLVVFVPVLVAALIWG